MKMPSRSAVSESAARPGKTQPLVACGGLILLEALFAVLYHFRNLEAHAIGTIAVGFAAGIVYFVVLYGLEHSRAHRATLWIILGGALLFRFTLLPLAPTLSNDPYRYHWDGAVQLAGYNPYMVSPDRLAFGSRIAPTGHLLPAHQIPNIYPPLMELLFRVDARFFLSAVGFKLPFFLADIFAVFLLVACLRRMSHRNFRLAIYAWNPLVIVEFAATGHSDSLAIAALLAAVLIIRSQTALSILTLAIATLLKVFPIMLFPLWLLRAGWPRTFRSWAAGFGSLALAVACFWPFRAALSDIPATLALFSKHWQNNNASLFAGLRAASGSARWADSIGEGAAIGVALWAAFRRIEPERAAFLIFGTILLVSTDAYPWYFTWIIPFLCFSPNPAWLLLTILEFLSYHVLIRYGILHQWHWSPLMIVLEYAPFYLWLAWDFSRGKLKLSAPVPSAEESTL